MSSSSASDDPPSLLAACSSSSNSPATLSSRLVLSLELLGRGDDLVIDERRHLLLFRQAEVP